MWIQIRCRGKTHQENEVEKTDTASIENNHNGIIIFYKLTENKALPAIRKLDGIN